MGKSKATRHRAKNARDEALKVSADLKPFGRKRNLVQIKTAVLPVARILVIEGKIFILLWLQEELKLTDAEEAAIVAGKIADEEKAKELAAADKKEKDDWRNVKQVTK